MSVIVYADNKKPKSGPKSISLEDRFWKKIDKRNEDECWNWAASIRSGYGHIWDGIKSMSAHRLSWVLHFGSIPKGLDVLHKCDNKRCVNPNHLYLGTQSDNARDMVIRNGSRKSRFYEGEAWLMKKLYKSGKFTQVQIAKMFKCCPGMISDIINGRILNFKQAERRAER